MPNVTVAGAGGATVTLSFDSAANALLAIRRAKLGIMAAALAQLSPQATLERGYSIVRDSNGSVVRSSAQLAAGAAVELRFAHGWAQGLIDKTG